MTTPPDIFRNSVLSVLSGVNTSLPGIIVDYDPSTNKATIQPALNKNYVSGVKPMPILENVPVMFPGGSNFNITFPLKKGDYVLLIFVQRSMDLWLSVGGQVTPNDPRKFDISDAIAIPGLQPFTGDFSNTSGINFEISFGGSKISISPTGEIQIKTDSTVAIGTTTTELLNIVSQLMTLLQGATVMGTAFGGPLNPAFTAQVALIQTQLDAITGVIT